MKHVITIAGVSRGNPGPAACSFVAYDDVRRRVAAGGWFLGDATVNIAEFTALIWALKHALALHVTEVVIQSDSPLLAAYAKGQTPARAADLKLLRAEIERLIAQFESYLFELIPRAANRETNNLALEALHKQEPVGSFVVGLDSQQETLFSVREEAQTNIRVEHGALDQRRFHTSRTVDSSGTTAHEGDSPRSYQPSYELTVKTKIDSFYPQSLSEGAIGTWNIEAHIIGQELDQWGHMVSFSVARLALIRASAVFSAAEENAQDEMPEIPSELKQIDTPRSLEDMARIIAERMVYYLPDTVKVNSVGLWSNHIGVKMLYRMP